MVYIALHIFLCCLRRFFLSFLFAVCTTLHIPVYVGHPLPFLCIRAKYASLPSSHSFGFRCIGFVSDISHTDNFCSCILCNPHGSLWNSVKLGTPDISHNHNIHHRHTSTTRDCLPSFSGTGVWHRGYSAVIKYLFAYPWGLVC